MSSTAPRYAAAGPCPTCGSTDTYAELIEVPMLGDVPRYPTIPGELHCRACEEATSGTFPRWGEPSPVVEAENERLRAERLKRDRLATPPHP